PPPPAAPRRATPARAASANPFDFEAPARPAYDEEEDYEDDRPSRRRGGRRLSGWDKVLSGFLFLYLSAGGFVLSYLLSLLLPSDGQRPSEAGVKIVLVLTSLTSVAAVVLGALGLARCGAVPYQTGAKGAATSAAVAMVLAALGSLVAAVLILLAV